MSPRRSAFIDIGTNAILCLIADIRDTGRFRVLDDLADIARLGEGVDRTGRISPEGEQRALGFLSTIAITVATSVSKRSSPSVPARCATPPIAPKCAPVGVIGWVSTCG